MPWKVRGEGPGRQDGGQEEGVIAAVQQEEGGAGPREAVLTLGSPGHQRPQRMFHRKCIIINLHGQTPR